MTIEKKLISKKKPFYPISEKLENFLRQHDRWIEDVISYEDLLRYSDSINIYDKNNKDTLWVRLLYTTIFSSQLQFQTAETQKKCSSAQYVIRQKN